jgi:serine/threonine protein kinase
MGSPDQHQIPTSASSSESLWDLNAENSSGGVPNPTNESGDATDCRHPIDLLADEYSARLRAGESPSIEEYAQRAPEHQAAIWNLFPTIAAIEEMSQQDHLQRQSKRRSLENQDIIGDFRIVREVGRGGMGIVYEAEQRSLQRRVALKVLSSGIASSPHQLQRFQLEAESISRLHHTNIVEVYGIGEESGTHFYAMQFIDGIPLSNAIESERSQSLSGPKHINATPSSTMEETATIITEPDEDRSWDSESFSGDRKIAVRIHETSPSQVAKLQSATHELFSHINTGQFFRKVARLAAQVAGALDYAHQHGVLHRDIKPSNLMLDRSGAVWITDFGLAKIAESNDLTRTGEIVGTLRYMAPEQLNGRASAATDIYSLGLTLFEMLTLKPAFEGDSSATLAQRLRGCDVPRPRTINPKIPKDLETIILKATAREPSARYASAGSLAEDLNRFCDDRPILARRSTVIERLWRWSRRNPALATATASCLFLSLAVVAIITKGRLKVEAALEEAKTAQIQAENNIDLAIKAFGSILDNVTSRGVPRSLAEDLPESVEGLSQTPLSAADAMLLDQLLKFYREFAEQSEHNSERRRRIAQAHHRAGTILVQLGRLSEAKDDFESAIKLLATTPKNDAAYVASVVERAAIKNEIGELRLRLGDFRQTWEAHLEARAMLLEQPSAVRAEPSVRFELARATDLFASIDVRSGSNEGPSIPPIPPNEGRPPRWEGDRPPPGGDRLPFDRNGPQPDWDRPPPARDGRRPPPDDRRMPPEYAPGGRRGFGRGRPEGGGPEDDLPKHLRDALPKTMKNLGGPIDGLAATLEQACDEFRSLRKEFPGNTQYQVQLAQCLRHRLVHAAARGNTSVVKETFTEAVEILDQLAKNYPEEPRYLFEMADTLTQASRAQSVEAAMASLDRAVVAAKELATRFPSVSEYQLLLGTAIARQAAVQADRGLTEEAQQGLQQSIDILEELAKKFPKQGIFQIPLARTCQQLADLLRTSASREQQEVDRLQEARQVLDESIARFNEYLSSTDGKPGNFNSSTQANLYSSLADTLTALGEHDEAEKTRQNASAARRPGLPPH